MPVLSRITQAAGLGPGCRGPRLRLTQLPALHHTRLPQAANPPQLMERRLWCPASPATGPPGLPAGLRFPLVSCTHRAGETQLSRKSSSFFHSENFAVPAPVPCDQSCVPSTLSLELRGPMSWDMVGLTCSWLSETKLPIPQLATLLPPWGSSLPSTHAHHR